MPSLKQCLQCPVHMFLFGIEISLSYTKWAPFRRRSGIPGDSRGFQGFPGVSRGFQGFPGVSRGFQGFPGVFRGFQGFPGVQQLVRSAAQQQLSGPQAGITTVG